MDTGRGNSRSQLPNVSSSVNVIIPHGTITREVALAWNGRTEFFSAVEPSSFTEVAIRSIFEVWILGGVNIGRMNCPIYCEVSFAAEFSKDIPDILKSLVKGRPPEAYFWESNMKGTRERGVFDYVTRNRLRRPVFIPAEVGHIRGYFFDALMKRPERIYSLFISRYGIVNPIPCSRCVRSFSVTVTATGEHVTWPYHLCISIPGAYNGCCSNCKWDGRGDCGWRGLRGYQFKPEDQGKQVTFLGKDWTKDATGPMIPDFLNISAAPRLWRCWPSLSEGGRMTREDAKRVMEENPDGI